MEHSVQIFNYNNAEITFQLGKGEVMVNATEMAKSFGKRPLDWLRTNQSKDYLEALSAVRICVPTDLVQVINGGSNYGTWMHEDVALEFARWLNPAFAIWCNARIKELLKHGVTLMPNKIEEILADPDTIIQLASAIKQERLEKDRYRMQAELQEKELKAAAPIVNYANQVLQSTDVYVLDQVAKELGTTALTLNKLLKQLGVQFKRNGQWVLSAKFADRGLTKTRTYAFTHRDGNQGTNTHTVWTEVGRRFIHDLMDSYRSGGRG